MLSVSLLGVFRVSRIEPQIWSDLGSAGRGLASFLFAFPDRPHRRERLAELFWPELGEERSRRALNSAIWRLRKVLGAASESKGQINLRTIGSETVLERAAWLDIDAWAMRQSTAIALDEPEKVLPEQTLRDIAAVL